MLGLPVIARPVTPGMSISSPVIGSKLGDKKIVQKLDKDGTVLKTKTKQIVSKKLSNNRSGMISIKKSKKSPYADEGVEGFSNKKTRYRATRTKKQRRQLTAGIFGASLVNSLGLGLISGKMK